MVEIIWVISQGKKKTELLQNKTKKQNYLVTKQAISLLSTYRKTLRLYHRNIYTTLFIIVLLTRKDRTNLVTLHGMNR